MIVVADTTPIISLIKSRQLDLLQKLFEVVYIPEAVYKELTENERYFDEACIIKECDYIKVKRVENKSAIEILRNLSGLDAGESEAIVLASAMNSDVLLMDEHKGRRIAIQMGITITGTIGILSQAFNENILTMEEVESCIMCLQKNHIRISESLFHKLREYIGKKIE